MAVPKKKISISKKRKKNSNLSINKLNIFFEEKSKEPRLRHHVCLKNGFYRNYKYLDI